MQPEFLLYFKIQLWSIHFSNIFSHGSFCQKIMHLRRWHWIVTHRVQRISAHLLIAFFHIRQLGEISSWNSVSVAYSPPYWRKTTHDEKGTLFGPYTCTQEISLSCMLPFSSLRQNIIWQGKFNKVNFTLLMWNGNWLHNAF